MADILKTAALPSETGAFRGGDSTGPAQKGSMEQAWLRELERAQWSQRPVADAKHAGAARDGAHAPGEDGSGTGVRTRLRAGPQEPAETRVRSEPAAAARASARHSGEPGGGIGRQSPRGTALPAAPYQTAGKPAASGRASVLESMIEARLWGEMRIWERRKALVLEREGRVRVWLRDAELSPDRADDTVACLARLVRESGLELEAVTINGCVVFGANDGERGARKLD